jgi:aspartate-semialdehyde dehydrogenase
LIANPNCSTVQLVVVLKPIHDVARIKRVVVATYQSASGAGKEAVEELIAQTTSLIEKRKFDGIGETFEPKYLPRQIAFNVIPQIDVFQGNNYTKEEMKMVLETKKIMEDDSIKVTATCVRVPVIIGHSEAVNIETGKKLTPAQVREILSKAKGVRVIDDPINKVYPTPIDAASLDETLVGRIREDISHPSAIDLWIVSDNLRKGAALNAVQIAEALVEMKLV